jgi:hypothetical protein
VERRLRGSRYEASWGKKLARPHLNKNVGGGKALILTMWEMEVERPWSGPPRIKILDAI